MDQAYFFLIPLSSATEVARRARATARHRAGARRAAWPLGLCAVLGRRLVAVHRARASGVAKSALVQWHRRIDSAHPATTRTTCRDQFDIIVVVVDREHFSHLTNAQLDSQGDNKRCSTKVNLLTHKYARYFHCEFDRKTKINRNSNDTMTRLLCVSRVLTID